MNDEVSAAPVLPERAEVAVAEILRRLQAGQGLARAEIADLLGVVGDELTDQVRGTHHYLQRLRRRDRELLALIDSTHDLLEIHDATEVLHRLVDRAHQLVGTDVTYMSVYEPSSHELFVRASRGTISSRFVGLRVPAGIGIASRVVDTLTPQWAADYWAAGEFAHDPEIDSILVEERLRSLLGVPVAANGEILGVLFAADREPHQFGGDQIALLSAFADQAAIILRTTRLFAAATEAAQRAERHADAIGTAARVHERLMALVLAGHGPDEVATTLGESLGRPVAIVGADLAPVVEPAQQGRWFADGVLARPLQAAAEESRATGRCTPVAALQAAAVTAVMAGARHLGLIVVGGAPGLTEVERRTVERGAQIVALLTMQQEAMTEAEDRVRGEVALDVLSGQHSDLAGVRRRLTARGLPGEGPWTVVAIPVPANARHAAARALATERGWLSTVHGAGVLVLAPGVEMERVARMVRDRLGGHLDRSACVVGHTGADLAQVPAVAQESWECAGLLAGLAAQGLPVAALVSVEEYAPYLAMFGADGERAVAFLNRTLGPVLTWDAEHGTDLVGTILAFLDSGSNHTRTARALFVHPNTVKQRLERVSLLLGAGWRDRERVFRVEVAARLHAAGRLKVT